MLGCATDARANGKKERQRRLCSATPELVPVGAFAGLEEWQERPVVFGALQDPEERPREQQ